MRWWNSILSIYTNWPLVKVDAKVIYTGNTSIHIAVDVYSRGVKESEYRKTTHCVIVFVSVDEDGKPTPVEKLISLTDEEKELERYAKRLVELRTSIENEMSPFIKN